MVTKFGNGQLARINISLNNDIPSSILQYSQQILVLNGCFSLG